MVHNRVWESARAPSRGFLCIGCLEVRLGRQLNSVDFSSVMVNDLGIADRSRYAWSFRSVRLASRLNGQLALW
jgi:hypothetical protein